MAKQPGSEQPRGRELPPRQYPGIEAMNYANFPQQISFLYRRIFLGHAVAARDQKVFFVQTALAHHAMNKKTSATDVKHKIARF